MKATELLKRQRRCVRALFSRVEVGELEALRELSRVLVAQLAVERELFYPAVMHLAQNEVLESWDNHSLALKALSRALAARRRGKTFRSRVEVLKGVVLNLHAAEEHGLFARVESNVPDERLESLGQEMEERFFQQLRRLWEKDYTPPARRRRTTELTRIARVQRRSRPPSPESLQHWPRVA
ncbi:MAG: hypothetical protein ABJB12_05085 [Pseudomonadota bacterium]